MLCMIHAFFAGFVFNFYLIIVTFDTVTDGQHSKVNRTLEYFASELLTGQKIPVLVHIVNRPRLIGKGYSYVVEKSYSWEPFFGHPVVVMGSILVVCWSVFFNWSQSTFS